MFFTLSEVIIRAMVDILLPMSSLFLPSTAEMFKKDVQAVRSLEIGKIKLCVDKGTLIGFTILTFFEAMVKFPRDVL